MHRFLILLFSAFSFVSQLLFAHGIDIHDVKDETIDIRSIGDGTSTCMH